MTDTPQQTSTVTPPESPQRNELTITTDGPSPWPHYPRNDAERAYHFRDRFSLRFSPNTGWEKAFIRASTGKTDSDQLPERYVLGWARNYVAWLMEQSELIEDYAIRKAAVKEAVQAGNMPHIRAMIELARCK